jgi:hypothetical protein
MTCSTPRERRLPLAAGVFVAVLALAATGLWALPSTAASGTDPVTIGASDDTYTRSGMLIPAGQVGAVIVGGTGAAVGYLKFDVATLPDGPGALRASLVLTPVRLANVASNTVIEVRTVPSTSWTESTLTSVNAPAVGPVVAVAALYATAVTVTFDLSATITHTGTYALALTTPTEDQQRLFVSTEGGTGPRIVLSRGGDPTPPPSPTPTPPPPPGGCTVGVKLVPTCGVLLGVAPGARTPENRVSAMIAFEASAQAGQDIYHAYHRGLTAMFPTRDEIALARQPGHHRILFLNWKPAVASWASIARGNAVVDHYIDRLAGYIKGHFTEPFFLTVHHEPENDVIERPGSGMTAGDYAAMFRHVVLRLRADGATNVVTVMDYMAYTPWNTMPWFPDMYPGSDVVDWVAWDTYAYSIPHAYGYGDFAEMQTRGHFNGWTGIYAWAAANFPDKPLMVAEWGVWYSGADPTHQGTVYDSVAAELPSFPQIKALVYFDTPRDGRGRSSLIGATSTGLNAFRAMSANPLFKVAIP